LVAPTSQGQNPTPRPATYLRAAYRSEQSVTARTHPRVNARSGSITSLIPNVFGDVVGRRVAIVRKAWDTAVLKAHGHQPTWCGSNTLAPPSPAALRAIDLHFHDLRHEAGSRFIEAGWPLHHVQDMLGHKNVAQTSTYLNATPTGLQESMRRYDENGARCKIVASDPAIGLTPSCNGPSTYDAQPLVN
jgi:integrase